MQVRTQKQFTLVELLTYGALLSLVMTVSFQMLMLAFEHWETSREQQDAWRQARQALVMFGQDLRSMRRVTEQAGGSRTLLRGEQAAVQFAAWTPTETADRPATRVEYCLVPNEDSAELSLCRRVRAPDGKVLSQSSFDRIDDVSFQYRARTARDDSWAGAWPSQKSSLPGAVEMTIRFREGARQGRERHLSTRVFVPALGGRL